MQMIYLAEKIRSIPNILYFYRSNPFSAMHKRPHGIDYYLPIINGWMRSDDMMKLYENDIRGRLRAGYVLSCIYVIDMAKEHYWYNGTSAELYGTINQHPINPYFLHLNPQDISPKKFKEYTLFRKHPRLFKFKHNILGIFIRTYKLFSNLKQNWFQKQKR